LKNHGAGGGELVHCKTPTFHAQRLHRTSHLPPDVVAEPIPRRGYGHGPRTEYLYHLPQYVCYVVVDGADTLEAGVAETVLWSDVDGGVPIPVHAIHGIPTRVEGEVADKRLRVDFVYPGELRHLLPGRVAGFSVLRWPEKLACEDGVQLGHADLHGE